MTAQKTVDAAVVGAGPAGLAAGLALAEMGFNVAVIGPAADPRDGRTAALFQGSVQLLKRLGAWRDIAPNAEPLVAIRLIDATGALFRAPEVTFRASEISASAFGYNVPNAVLTAALELVAARRLTRVITAAVTRIEAGAEHVTLNTADGAVIKANLVAAADGRASPCRAAAGIETKTWAYDQAAVVCSFSHSRAHHSISTEFHRRSGPCTVVPGPGNTSSLVWVETPAEATRIAALEVSEFVAELGKHLGGLLGTLSDVSLRRMFPLSGQTALTMARNRIALVGEAGHVMPPIGAQGLNLSLRDAATLAEVAGHARDAGQDIGGPDALARYDSARHTDVTSRIWTVDLLNRSLLSSIAPVHMLRGLGLFALSTVGPLRRAAMQAGIAPNGSVPYLMQPPAGLALEAGESDAAALDGPSARHA